MGLRHKMGNCLIERSCAIATDVSGGYLYYFINARTPIITPKFELR
jgi:hypothetical protein